MISVGTAHNCAAATCISRPTCTRGDVSYMGVRSGQSRPLTLFATYLSALLICLGHALRSPVFAADGTASSIQDSVEILTDQAAARALSAPQANHFALDGGGRRGRETRASNLDVVSLTGTSDGLLRVSPAPTFSGKLGGRYASITPRNNVVFYTLDPDLQEFVSHTVEQAGAKHVAVVAMNPITGAILAIAGRSPSIPSIEYHAGFPAASLFKVVTAAAAVEEAGIAPDSIVMFRGGTYTLNQSNYLPNPRADHRTMSVGEAMGRSCNPVFGHLGIKHLDGSILNRYAQRFGFNRPLPLEVALQTSSAKIPSGDLFELSRTSAGFGEVRISPVHAAAMVSAVANGGLLPRPYLVERIADFDGVTLERTRPEALQRVVQPDTARTLLEMMQYTTTTGTSRREFMRGGRPALGSIEVAGKTGTLSGSNPAGLNNWFIGAAPLNTPEIAVAVITVDATYSAKASRLARLVMQRYFKIDPGPEVQEPQTRRGVSKSSKHRRIVKASHHRSKTLKSKKTPVTAKKKSSGKGTKQKTKDNLRRN